MVFSLTTSRLCKTDYEKKTTVLHSENILWELIMSDLHPNINLHCHVFFFHFRVSDSSWPNFGHKHGTLKKEMTGNSE